MDGKRGSKKMIKKRVIELLYSIVPENRWKQFWLFTPISFCVLFPLSLILFNFLTYTRWTGIGRALQTIMIVSVLGGIVSGVLSLLLIDELDFSAEYKAKLKWLSRLAIVLPIFWILISFLLASIIK